MILHFPTFDLSYLPTLTLMIHYSLTIFIPMMTLFRVLLHSLHLSCFMSLKQSDFLDLIYLLVPYFTLFHLFQPLTFLSLLYY